MTVELDPRRPASATALNAALSQAGLDATVDDHGRWMHDVERSGAAVRGAAITGALLVAAAAGSVIAFAHPRGSRGPGATWWRCCTCPGPGDRYIAGLFQRRFRLPGCALGGPTARSRRRRRRPWPGVSAGSDGFTPVLPFAWSDLLAAAPCPLAAALVAAVAARRTAMAILGERT